MQETSPRHIAISLLLPTRNRPDRLRRFLTSASTNAADPSQVEAVIYVDDDDRATGDVSGLGIDVVTIVGPRTTMGHVNSACIAKARGDILMLVNDDVFVRSREWDTALRRLHDGFPDHVYLAYPDDLLKRERVSTFPIFSRAVAKSIEQPSPGEYKGALIDYHLFDIFQRLRRFGSDRIRFLPEVVFEHEHPKRGHPLDQTYRDRDRWADDTTFLLLRDARSAAARRLASLVGPPVEPAPPRAAPSTRLRPLLGARFIQLFRAFALDSELPLAWRAYLFMWFCARLTWSRYVDGARSSKSDSSS
jgi:hypothetical protein